MRQRSRARHVLPRLAEKVRAIEESKPRIGIISLSVIPDDPRVRKQGDLLAAAGWQVVAIGLPGHRSKLPAWRCLSAEGHVATDVAAGAEDPDAELRRRASHLLAAIREAPRTQGLSRVTGWLKCVEETILLAIKDPAALLWIFRRGMRRMFRSFAWILALRLPRALKVVSMSISHAGVESFYWSLNDKFRQIYETARREKVDLWLANDWPMLPIARRLAAEQGAAFAYDTHELAIDEYSQRWTWRLVHRPVIAAIEGMVIREAAFVSCVSDGIAVRLAQFYRLHERPFVIRNIPQYELTKFRPTEGKIRVLYHGLVSPGRGLEACVESVPLWRPEFILTIRGPGNPEFLVQLARLASKCGVTDRVTFAEAVPMVELVRKATEHDIGLFALPSHSLQNVYALPNKFFEYMMAGLALCISDLPEMTRLLKARNLGVLIEAVTPQAIAASVNRLDRASIDAYKHNALVAARELSWENEGRRLLEACERAVSANQR